MKLPGNTMKNIRTILLILGISFVTTVQPALGAETPTSSSPVDKAIESVKDTVGDLVTAKDGGSKEDLSLRIEAYRKVMSLALAEAKDLKVKLIAVDDVPKSISSWKENAIENLGKAVKYYESRIALMDRTEESFLTLDDIRSLASTFKEERDAQFTDTANEVRDFLLIDQQNDVITTAQSRLKKVSDDVLKLQKARVKNSEALVGMLKKATKLIEKAAVGETAAQKAFILLRTTKATSSPTSTVPVETPKDASASSTASSTAPVAPSPRSLVKNSLSDIKDAYQIFIDMSALVRKAPASE